MPQSLSNILVHIVFSTKDRVPFLRDARLRSEMHAVIGGTSESLKETKVAEFLTTIQELGLTV